MIDIDKYGQIWIKIPQIKIDDIDRVIDKQTDERVRQTENRYRGQIEIGMERNRQIQIQMQTDVDRPRQIQIDLDGWIGILANIDANIHEYLDIDRYR